MLPESLCMSTPENLDVEVIPNKASTEHDVNITVRLNGLKDEPDFGRHVVSSVALVGEENDVADTFRLLTKSYK